jgi:hypothetical protein
MSRSQYKKPKEVPIATEVLIRNIMKSRRCQYRVHRKPPNGHGGRKLGKTTKRFPPKTGWPGGDWKNNLGFTTPQK